MNVPGEQEVIVLDAYTMDHMSLAGEIISNYYFYSTL